MLAFLERESAAGHRLVAAFVIATQGSTYRKPGALMLLSASGARCGLLSGGCLEGDLHEHARAMLAGACSCRAPSRQPPLSSPQRAPLAERSISAPGLR